MPRKDAPPRPARDAVATLIRQRRLQLGWSYARAARAAGIASPSNVFHIENGEKAPGERVAARLAEALGLDAGLLAAWSVARGRRDLATTLDATARLARMLGAGAAGEGGGDAGTKASTPPAAAGARDDGALDVPLLPEGSDPDAPDAPTPLDVLRLDRRLFPALPQGGRFAAYRLSAHAARRLPGALHPGDVAVVRIGGEDPPLDAPCAVRIAGRVEIVPVRVREGGVYVPAPGHASDPDDAGDRVPGSAAETLVGPVVLAFRRWL